MLPLVFSISFVSLVAASQPAAAQPAASQPVAASRPAASQPAAASQPTAASQPVASRSEAVPKAVVAQPVAATPKEGLTAKLARYLSVYGILRLDASLDSARVGGGGNWAFWVLRDFEGTVGGRTISDGSSDEIHLHARNTRFGIKLDAGEVDFIKARVFGQLELDFFGGDTDNASWKSLPRLRIGAVTVDWGLGWGHLELMAGNHWDTFGKLNPTLVDAGILWWGGNLGARRPQLRLSAVPTLGERVKLSLSTAVARPFDIADPDYDGLGKTDADGKPLAVGNGTNDGEDSGIPQIQWRVGLDGRFPAWGSSLMLAMGGHYQRAEVATPAGSLGKTHFDSWSLVFELALSITRWFGIRGEAFTGQNLKDVMGGVKQDINPATGEAITAKGFWAELNTRPFEWWSIAVGMGGDYPDADTLVVTTAAQVEALRFSNQTVYGTMDAHLGKGLHAQLGYMFIRTGYRLVSDVTAPNNTFVGHTAQNHRFQLAAFYKF